MAKTTCARMWAAALLLLAVASGCASAGRLSRGFSDDRVLVRWKDGAAPADLTGRFRIMRHRARVGTSTVAVPLGSTVEATLKSLRADPRVLYASPNYRRRIMVLPSPNEPVWNVPDPTPDYTTRQYGATVPTENQRPFTWALQKIQALEAWSVYPGAYLTAQTRATDPVKVAVLDTGCDMSHPDWIPTGGTSPDVLHGGQLNTGEAVSFSTRTPSGDPTPLTGDPVGHGTFTAGIIGAAVNNSTGNSANSGLGLAFPAQILPIQVLNTAEGGTVEDEIDGIYYAVDHGALIISMSLGDYNYTPFEQDAVDYAWEHNVLVVAAAGNDGVGCSGPGQNRITYPAADNHVLAVGATGPDDAIASYSNTGGYVGISAPGGDQIDAGVVLFDIIDMPTQFGIWSLFPTVPYDLQNPTDPCSGMEVTDYTSLSYDYNIGTSAACPFVSALAALYAMKFNITRNTPNAPAILWQAVQRAAENIQGVANGGWSQYGGFGRINALNTLLNTDTRSATVGCIVGKVTSNATPVANGRVTATMGTVTKSATTRADGGFRLANLTPGTWAVTGTGPLGSGTINVNVLAGVDNFGADFALPWPPGDTDHSGKVDIRDAVMALRLLAGSMPADDAAKARADIYPWSGTGGRTHGDGLLTVDDVGAILKIAAGVAW